jgi:hypothetical protein
MGWNAMNPLVTDPHSVIDQARLDIRVIPT